MFKAGVLRTDRLGQVRDCLGQLDVGFGVFGNGLLPVANEPDAHDDWKANGGDRRRRKKILHLSYTFSYNNRGGIFFYLGCKSFVNMGRLYFVSDTDSEVSSGVT